MPATETEGNALMADQPEDDATWFKVLAIVPEYRTYMVAANSEDEARIAVLNGGLDSYDRGEDVDDDIEVLDIWEDYR